MTIGYSKPLYLLPFDHRGSYLSGMFHMKPPLNEAQHAKVADSKHVIYEGFVQAVADGVPRAAAGILVDEEFGTEVLRAAAKEGYITALSSEKSGVDEFEFEYGAEFAAHIEAFDPGFVKVLVRYNPEGDEAGNRRQTGKLKKLSDYCVKTRRRFMFELLVPATDAQLARVHGDKQAYDLRVRPDLMIQSIEALQEAGIEPAVWKIEGLDRHADCERLVATAQRGGRSEVGSIVLGRGADEERVKSWLRTAAAVPGFIGFAVGRTSFWDAVADYEGQKTPRQEAAARIAKRYRAWVDIFENARQAAPDAEVGQ